MKTGFVRQSSKLPEVINWFSLNTRSAFPLFIILLRLRRSISEIMKLFSALEVGLLPIISGKSNFVSTVARDLRTVDYSPTIYSLKLTKHLSIKCTM